jgi:hypothetical protein
VQERYITNLDIACGANTVNIMVKRAKGRSAKAGEAPVVIYTRLKSTTVEALDEIRGSMPLTPTRSQIINEALAEYVERHASRGRKRLKHADMLKRAEKSPPPQSWFDEDTQALRQSSR